MQVMPIAERAGYLEPLGEGAWFDDGVWFEERLKSRRAKGWKSRLRRLRAIWRFYRMLRHEPLSEQGEEDRQAFSL